MSRQIGADRPAQSRGVSAAITPGLFAGFAAIVVVLVTARIIGTVNLRNVYTSSEAVSHTHTVKDALQQVLTTALDAETGGRGFLILGIDSYLEPYNRARLAMAGNIARARALTTDDREQHADVDRLSVEVDLKMSELAEAIRQRRESGFAAAQAAVATNVGKRTMDEMRSIVARMDAREDVLLSARTAQASQSYRSGLVTGFATTSLALLAVAALFFVARRSGVERLRNAEMAERLRVTLASIGDGVIATDDQGRVVSLNAVAESLTGWSAGEAEGRRLEEIFVMAVCCVSASSSDWRTTRCSLPRTAGKSPLTIAPPQSRRPMDASWAPSWSFVTCLTGEQRSANARPPLMPNGWRGRRRKRQRSVCASRSRPAAWGHGNTRCVPAR
jgi:CHASE3 domain sensor protein